MRSLPVLIPIVAGVLLLLVAAMLVLVLVWQRFSPAKEPVPTTSPGAVEITPTKTTASPVPPSATECQTIVRSDNTQVAVPLPASLVLGEQSMTIVPVIPQDRSLPYPAGQSGTAVWLCGTVVNYVVALEPTTENNALLGGLRPGDEITLQLAGGADLVFRFAELREFPAGDPGVLGQSYPHLTLILQSDSGDWTVATADYAAETEPLSQAGGPYVPLGQPAPVGDIQVIVERGHTERDDAAVEPGTMVYLVEFSIENTGSVPVSLNDFVLQLQDGEGNWYSASAEASAAGEHGWLMTDIAPSSTARGTAGYVVPRSIAGPAVIWKFAALNSGADANFSIPYLAEGNQTETVAVGVVVTDAFLNRSGDMVVVEAELTNPGKQVSTVEVGKISLTSSTGASELRLAAPPLPWTIEPGMTRVVELQFARPDASTALLTLMGYTFEIQGLR